MSYELNLSDLRVKFNPKWVEKVNFFDTDLH
jgi:hypothetical protein